PSAVLAGALAGELAPLPLAVERAEALSPAFLRGSVARGVVRRSCHRPAEPPLADEACGLRPSPKVAAATAARTSNGLSTAGSYAEPRTGKSCHATLNDAWKTACAKTLRPVPS